VFPIFIGTGQTRRISARDTLPYTGFLDWRILKERASQAQYGFRFLARAKKTCEETPLHSPDARCTHHDPSPRVSHIVSMKRCLFFYLKERNTNPSHEFTQIIFV